MFTYNDTDQILQGFTFIDLFCGIGGFHSALSSLGARCVFASDIDKFAKAVYEKNYGLKPHGDITKIKVLIELPPCGDDRESVKQLEDAKFIHPGYEVYGNLDMFYIGKDGKKKIAYSHISCVIEALEDMLMVGVKNYSVTYTCKKNTSLSEFDFKKVVNDKKQEEFAKLTKKQKTKDLI